MHPAYHTWRPPLLRSRCKWISQAAHLSVTSAELWRNALLPGDTSLLHFASTSQQQVRHKVFPLQSLPHGVLAHLKPNQQAISWSTAIHCTLPVRISPFSDSAHCLKICCNSWLAHNLLWVMGTLRKCFLNGWGCSSVVEFLSSRCKALCLSLCTSPTKEICPKCANPFVL